MLVQSDFSLFGDKDYKREWDKLAKIQDQIAKAEEEVQELDSEGVLKAIQDERRLRVKAVIDGKNPDTVDVTQAYRASLQKANQRIYLLKDAKEEQKNILSKQRIESSNKIAQEVKPKYGKIIKDMALRWIELGELIMVERELRESLNDNDICFTSHFDPMPFYHMGDPRIYNSNYSQWLIECVDRGYLKGSEVPKNLRDFWFKSDGIKLKGII